MAVTPTGPRSLPLLHLRNAIAASARFQAIVGATGETPAELAASAAAKIFYFDADDTDETQAVPRAIIDLEGEQSAGQAGLNSWTLTGQLVFTLQYETAEENLSSISDAKLQLLNDIGAIESQIKSLANTGQYLDVRATRLQRIGISAPEGNNGSWWSEAEVTVTYGGMML